MLSTTSLVSQNCSENALEDLQPTSTWLDSESSSGVNYMYHILESKYVTCLWQLAVFDSQFEEQLDAELSRLFVLWNFHQYPKSSM